MISYIEKNDLPFGQIGTESPNTIVFKFIDAGEDGRSFPRADLQRDQYVFYSNVFNMFGDEEIDMLKTEWILEKEYKFMQVKVSLYGNPYWTERKYKEPPIQ